MKIFLICLTNKLLALISPHLKTLVRIRMPLLRVLTKNKGIDFWIVNKTNNLSHLSSPLKAINHWWKGKPPIFNNNLSPVSARKPAPSPWLKINIKTRTKRPPTLWIKKNFKPLVPRNSPEPNSRTGINKSKFSSISTQIRIRLDLLRAQKRINKRSLVVVIREDRGIYPFLLS